MTSRFLSAVAAGLAWGVGAGVDYYDTPVVVEARDPDPQGCDRCRMRVGGECAWGGCRFDDRWIEPLQQEERESL